MLELPIDAALPQIIAEMRRARSVVVVAPPGAGKTTRVPPAILDAGLLSSDHPNLVMLQPRRVAARAAAQRIADEQNWTLGGKVGYVIRFERKIGPDTRLRVITEGILTRQLLDDPSLDGIGCVVLDEFHERSLHTDMAIAMLREVRRSLRPDLLLVVMSATLAAEAIAKFLDNCPIVRAEARLFPVQIDHRAPAAGRLHDRVADAVQSIEDSGDILAFLPGAAEIRATMRVLSPHSRNDDILPLHGSLPFSEQLRALQPSPRRKIILATNIAETSLTIEGVRTVIDSGFARVAGYDPRRGLDRLQVQRISKASAEQRAGRAGRTGPGRCVRLWSAREHNDLAEFELPEVQRVDLCSAVLSLHAWGESDPSKFGWFEAPPAEALTSAQCLLEMLGALCEGRLTDIGRKLQALPVHPRIGRLLLAALHAGRLPEGAAMAAILEEKDILEADAMNPVQGPSDLLVRMDLLDRAEKTRFAAHLRNEGIDSSAARQVARTRDQLLRIARNMRSPPATASRDDTEILRWPLLAYPDRVVRRCAADPDAGVMVGGGGVRLARESVVRSGEFIVAIDARHDERSAAREALVRIASRVDVDWLRELFPHSIRHETAVEFDPSRQRVAGVVRVYYRDLLISETKDAPVDPRGRGEVLAAELRPRAVELIEGDERCAAWLARVRSLVTSMPEQTWPRLDESLFGQVITEAARNRRTVQDVLAVPLLALLQGHFDYQLLRLIDEQAPESIEVPTGNRIRLDYATAPRPILAVRLQEIFGLIQTPRVAGGRVPVLLHILGPNFRPVQITDDLPSFWKNTYPQVRKDLRIRYPKHSWPDDPITAKPVAKGGRARRS